MRKIVIYWDKDNHIVTVFLLSLTHIKFAVAISEMAYFIFKLYIHMELIAQYKRKYDCFWNVFMQKLMVVLRIEALT
jgi:hypothetical protein